MNPKPHANLGHWLHPKGGMKMAVAPQKTAHPAKAQVATVHVPKPKMGATKRKP